MANPSVVVLGGGLSGIATAYVLARAGWEDVLVVERGAALGGLAGSFEQDGRFYPLGYHHILDRDRALLFFLDLVGALPLVRWRRIHMLFHAGGRSYDLSRPTGFLAFPMTLADKLRFLRLMTRAFLTSDWSPWEGRAAAELVDAWAGPGVRVNVFDPLCRLKFDLSSSEVSAAWLGARLSFREGASPLGYIPNANWTKVLCDGLTRLLETTGVRVRLGTPVAGLRHEGDRIAQATLADGQPVGADIFVSTLPPPVYLGLVPEEGTPPLPSIRYTALISAVCATRQPIVPDFYWMNLVSLDHTACGLFVLSSLNPTIGARGDTCLNFVTHLGGADRALFRLPDDALTERYLADFRAIFGFELAPFWTHLTRVPMYSPIFDRGYRNPPVRSARWRNVYFAGNYRTFPSVASTGTALASGVETARQILRDHSEDTDLAEMVAAFRPPATPRA
jgi:protoporphyrinogen oxidase